MSPRYFYSYFDDTLHEQYHQSGEMVNRKPLIINFPKTKRPARNAYQGLATRMGKAFVKKLKRGETCLLR